MSQTYDWFTCTPCGIGFPAFDERTLSDKLFWVYDGPMATCPDCGIQCVSNSTVTYGRVPSTWEHGEG
jgi:hypothetical protein